jgi:hypothetical protein
MTDNNNNNNSSSSAVAFAMPSANFQGLSFATTAAALAPQMPQMQMQMQMQMGTSGIDFQHGSVLTHDFQDYKLSAAAAPANNAITFQQGNTQAMDSIMGSQPGGFPGTYMNMNSMNMNSTNTNYDRTETSD